MTEIANNTNRKFEIAETLVSEDGSIKYGFNTSDGRSVESIYFPYTGLLDRKHTEATVLCLSSQVGCPIGCEFCATGKIPNSRNLTLNEIEGQYSFVRKDIQNRGLGHIDSLAMMGMGEPLLNMDNVLEFASRMANIDEIKRFSISTVGLTPKIAKLSKSNINIKLYLSVHTPFDNERTEMIPVNKAYPIKEVVSESVLFAKEKGNTVVANYILIKDVNDSERHAVGLAKLLDPEYFDVQLNLWNHVSGIQFEEADVSRIKVFKDILEKSGHVVDVQLSKGTDVSGGCGQLSGAK